MTALLLFIVLQLTPPQNVRIVNVVDTRNWNLSFMAVTQPWRLSGFDASHPANRIGFYPPNTDGSLVCSEQDGSFAAGDIDCDSHANLGLRYDPTTMCQPGVQPFGTMTITGTVATFAEPNYFGVFGLSSTAVIRVCAVDLAPMLAAMPAGASSVDLKVTDRTDGSVVLWYVAPYAK